MAAIMPQASIPQLGQSREDSSIKDDKAISDVTRDPQEDPWFHKRRHGEFLVLVSVAFVLMSAHDVRLTQNSRKKLEDCTHFRNAQRPSG